MISTTLFAKNPEWINYTTGNHITSTAIEGDYICIGTTDGLVRLNKTSGEKVFYNTANSGLPDNRVMSLAIDGRGNKWIGTWFGGLAVYNKGVVVSVEENKNNVPVSSSVAQCYPNPFNDFTTIGYSVPFNFVLSV